MKKLLKSRVVQVSIFVGIFSLFIFVANWVVYEALVSIFSVFTFGSSLALGIILGFLSVSFIASTIWGMYQYNFFTRIYSLISSAWMGFFTYLFFASVLYGIVAIFGVAHLTMLGLVFVVIALVVSVYGVIHHRKIQIVEKEIKLPNLPTAWKGKKLLWISDIHLGQILGPTYARKIAEKISKLPHDIIFIGGDLFDGTAAPDLHKLILPLKELQAEKGVYFITGNHEEFSKSSEKFISAVNSIGVHVLQDKMVNVNGLQIVGVDYATTTNTENFKKILSSVGIDKAQPSILLKHEPKDVDVAFEAGISFMISGHTHKGQQWPFRYIADSMYKGFGYGLKKFQRDVKEMHMFTSSGVGTWGPPMRVGSDCEIVIFTLQ